MSSPAGSSSPVPVESPAPVEASSGTSSPRSHRSWGVTIPLIFLVLLGGVGSQVIPHLRHHFTLTAFRPNPRVAIPSLAMQGGDPHVRALMRTISASEANDPNPYNLLYGGARIQNYDRHPDECLAILNGPNVGRCTTAAGRYQFLSTTWEEKAKQYHPNPSGWWLWTNYSFEPVYQDEVVYAWLSDRKAWQADIPQLLWDGELPTVLRLLSGTWTSLGYGIEDNDITPHLEQIYDQVLKEELKIAQAEKNTATVEAEKSVDQP